LTAAGQPESPALDWRQEPEPVRSLLEQELQPQETVLWIGKPDPEAQAAIDKAASSSRAFAIFMYGAGSVLVGIFGWLTIHHYWLLLFFWSPPSSFSALDETTVQRCGPFGRQTGSDMS